MIVHRSRCLLPYGLLAALALAACESGGGGKPTDPEGPAPSDIPPGSVVPGDDAEDFVSHVLGESGSGRAADGEASGGGAGGTGGASAPTLNGGANDSAARAIAEADILQREGDTLYALSRYAGLTVIDIADPERLRLLGGHRAKAEPFEMYVRNGVAYIMYNNYGRYSFDEDARGWVYQSSSHVTALDVANPTRITVIGDHEVPGNISDSRLVGDVLYLVTDENGYCWGCDQKPNTRVASFDVSDPAHFEKIDEVRFDNEGYGGQRSISVTSERIYVGGPSWENRDSDIRIVDIADPGGDLVLGASVPLHGSVESRWQMDEFEGVLRVISQPTPWRSNDPPYVQTFRVESSSHVTPLASLAVRLPRPEDLRSVRFDGTRAYAITFQQIDPLFTFDLSDPARPRQVGELEIPGFVYHMEPRGDRVYALGYDNAADAGSLHVSIFDVSELATPRMVDRVNFGGDWASLAEDQDRIHKAFNILQDEGLILVPFSGGDYDADNCHYQYQSGIQLIDFEGDDLALRGVAPQIGSARRAFVHRAHLFGVTDNALSVFDIADRGHPSASAQLEVARNISQIHVLGDTLLRFGTDWWTERTLMDFTALDGADTAEPVGELDLATITEDEESDACNRSSSWEGQLYVHGDVAYAPRRSYRWGQTGYDQQQTLTLYIIDLRDRSAPKVAGKIVTTAEGPEVYLGGVVITDHALLIGRGEGYYSYDYNGRASGKPPKYAYDIYDLSDPLAPAFTKRFEVPSTIAAGGWGWGFGGCGVGMPWGFWFPGSGSTSALVSGDLVVSQHEVDVDDGTRRVRYYLDRLDVSDPARPKLLPEINIPGQVVHFDGAAQRLVTLEHYLYAEKPADGWGTCNEIAGQPSFDSDARVCRTYRRRANALVLEGDTARRVSQVNLDSSARQSGSIAVSDERLFVVTYKHQVRYDGPPSEQRLESFAYNADGRFVRLPALEIEGDDYSYYSAGLYAHGARAFMSYNGYLTVMDTSDEQTPRATRHDTQGWGCASIEIEGERAYCALGQYGVFRVDL
jgi:hypothetical protein